MAVCPECNNGKHVNCNGQALDEKTDTIVPCACSDPECAHEDQEFQNRYGFCRTKTCSTCHRIDEVCAQTMSEAEMVSWGIRMATVALLAGEKMPT